MMTQTISLIKDDLKSLRTFLFLHLKACFEVLLCLLELEKLLLLIGSKLW